MGNLNNARETIKLMRLLAQRDYPAEWHVGEETYRIRFVRRFPVPDKDGDTYGLCCPETRTIFIRSGLTKNQILRTFLHEALHAIEFEYDLKIPHQLVYDLERAIADTLLANL